MTQCQEILNHLRNSGPITGADAYRLYGCMRLPARVSDLRDEGWPIKRRMVVVVNRKGERVHCAEYYMEGNAR